MPKRCPISPSDRPEFCTVFDGEREYHYSLEELLEYASEYFGWEFTTFEQLQDYEKTDPNIDVYKYVN